MEIKQDDDDGDLPDITIKKLHEILKLKRKENIKYIKKIYQTTKYNRFNNDLIPIYNHKTHQNITYFYEATNNDNDDEKNETSSYLFVAKKYKNLKQEMLNNTFHQITTEQWQDLYEKANDFIKCQTIINITAK